MKQLLLVLVGLSMVLAGCASDDSSTSGPSVSSYGK